MDFCLVVYSTDDDKFDKFKKAQYHNKYPILRIKNAKSVAEAYNSLLHVNRDAIKHEKLVFTHDDVRFMSDLNLYDSVVDKTMGDRTIIGLAGSKVFNPHKAPQWWAYKGQTVGEVCHQKDGKIWKNIYGPFEHQWGSYKYSKARVVDGLFLMMSKNFYFDKKPFSTARGNHFYDIRASLTAAQCIVMNFPVIHSGLGDSCLQKEYSEEALRLISDFS